MKKSLFFLLGLIISFLPGILRAQNTGPISNVTLSAKVFNSKTKEPLIGALVQIKGTTNGATGFDENQLHSIPQSKLHNNPLLVRNPGW